MLRWRYLGDNAALSTKVGARRGGQIAVRASIGRALAGPLLDLPAGRAIASVIASGPKRGWVTMTVTAQRGRQRLASAWINLSHLRSDCLTLSFDAPRPLQDVEVRIDCRLGVRMTIERVEIDLEREFSMEPLSPDRPVGYETRKSYSDKIEDGFFDRYLSGPNVMEVGYKGYDGGTVPVVPQAIGVDVGYSGYDGTSFPFADASFDAIYSSHCYEHIDPWLEVLRDWYRILKVGGFLIIVVPHQLLFERKRNLPSTWNIDHKRYYTPSSLLHELQRALPENGYRIRHLVENDKGFDYRPATRQATTGCYEIELVVEKIAQPYWTLDEGTVRAYPAGEFHTNLFKSGPWSIDLDLTQPYACLVWGPYVGLPLGRFEVDFHLEGELDRGAIPSLVFDVANIATAVASRTIEADDVSAALAGAAVTIPFENNTEGSVFEFRLYSGSRASTSRPRFRGVVVRYSDAPR